MRKIFSFLALLVLTVLIFGCNEPAPEEKVDPVEVYKEAFVALFDAEAAKFDTSMYMKTGGTELTQKLLSLSFNNEKVLLQVTAGVVDGEEQIMNVYAEATGKVCFGDNNSGIYTVFTELDEGTVEVPEEGTDTIINQLENLDLSTIDFASYMENLTVEGTTLNFEYNYKNLVKDVYAIAAEANEQEETFDDMLQSNEEFKQVWDTLTNLLVSVEFTEEGKVNRVTVDLTKIYLLSTGIIEEVEAEVKVIFDNIVTENVIVEAPAAIANYEEMTNEEFMEMVSSMFGGMM